MSKKTPMMEQYLKIKQENKDALLLFHLGDFYEMFFDDAVAASKTLHITLTSRGKNENKMPMAGIPCHAAENYIARLIKAGHKVAICEQVEDPSKTTKLVKREVTRVITPGTIIETPLLQEKSNNYILSFKKHAAGFGIAFADITTGEFRVTEASSFEELSAEIARLDPGECLFPEELSSDAEIEDLIAHHKRACTPLEGWKFKASAAHRELTSHFKIKTVDGLAAEDYPEGLACAGALLSYLKETQKTAMGHINDLKPYSLSEFMVIDRATRRNLELINNLNDGSSSGTLLEIIDETATSGGGRLIKQWLLQPLISAPLIKKRQQAVAEFHEDASRRKKARSILGEINDLERLIGKISCKRATPRDLAALKDSLKLVGPLRKELKGLSSELSEEVSSGLVDLDETVRLVESTLKEAPPLSIKDGGMIKEGCSTELDELRAVSKDGKKWIARLQAREIERTGISSLRVGYNRIFGYYLEVTKSNLKDIPENYTRKQTLVNAERFITPELKEYESKIFNASERIEELEHELFCRLRDKVAERVREIQLVAHNISVLDVINSLAEIAANRAYIKPSVNDLHGISITDGRHPVMEQSLGGNNFVANDLLLDSKDNRIIIITGPNMAGKSTYIRQAALLVMMAQIGSFIPAVSAEIGVVDRIFTRVGASDDISRGRSTFMVEMNETANILRNATDRSLIILDEIGRGTSTYDGVSIAWAVVEYLHNHPEVSAKTLFATHYHELTALSENLPSVKNYCVLVREWNGEIIFLRKVAEGISDKSYGIHVARLAGLPEEVISRAHSLLRHLEAGALEATKEDSSGSSEGAKVKQLDLFADSYGDKAKEIVNEIRHLDINNITPVEALKLLAKLKEKTPDEN